MNDIYEIIMTSTEAIKRLGKSTHIAMIPDLGKLTWYTKELQRVFIDIFREHQLHAVFQPILDLNTHQYIGFEGLIRGPQGSMLYSPDALFAVARDMKLQIEFESLCRNVTIAEFARAKLQGQLFLNSSINCLTDPNFIGKKTDYLERFGLHPSQIIIELTENQVVTDFLALKTVLEVYRRQGYSIAIDDFGEGFSNMRIWLEARPDFLKIDRYFISGIADDGVKFHLVQAIRDIAETCHVHIIAEGIETESELATVRDLKIPYGQGYLIARPELAPHSKPSESVLNLLRQDSLIVFPQVYSPIPTAVTARTLLNPVKPVSMTSSNDALFYRFEQDSSLSILPIVDMDNKPIGLISRYVLVDRYARPFWRELFGKKPCTLFMNTPITIDHDTPIHEIGRLLSQSEHHHMLDGFVITEYGRYIGIGSSQAVMSLITDMQIYAARYANPLTQLPGNVPINEHIDRLLANKTKFVACYCDLDHFKPYNDTYGYRQGDDIIQFLGKILTTICDSKRDFVGHIGGDDFMLLLQSADWEDRLHQGLMIFDDGIKKFLKDLHIQAGGYFGEDRKGLSIFHSLPALSIGCLIVKPGMFNNHHEVSAAVTDAKKQAKKSQGSSLFIERRSFAISE
jgi:EAL domain-containing protein (putative c-di-GMP-specific phosphodiesterase class I)/GGDEF domain-containing protein